jgi:hypothetical protein
MNKKLTSGLVLALVMTSGLAVYGQVKRPWRNGSVWGITMVKVKYGMEEAYLGHLTGQWKSLQETAKKDKMILSYKVLRTDSHETDDWNLLLMVEYKDLASMEQAELKEDNLLQKVVGDDTKQQQGYKDRLEIREIIGTRVARELVLEPRP